VRSDGRPGQPPAAEEVTERTRVTSVETFFDLVYVFAISHVTELVARENEVGAVRGGLLVALMWWVWVGYAWLGNAISVERRFMQITIFAAVAVLFLVGAAIPEAFVDDPAGFNAPLILVTCYVVARMLQAVAVWVTSRGRAGSRLLLGLVTPALVAGALLVCAALVPHRLIHDQLWIDVAKDGLWLLAIAVEYGAGFVVVRGWPIRSATLWSQRHQVIVLVALGEAFVGLGLGGTDIPVSGPLIAASLLGIVITAALWWAYFEVLSPIGELALRRSSGAARVALARDAYSFLHLPVLAGIVLFSLGLKKTMAFLDHLEQHGTRAPLDNVTLGALYGGVILYLLGVQGFQWRVTGRVSRLRVGATALLAASITVGGLMPALVAFGTLAAVAAGLVAAEFAPHTALHRKLRESLAAEER
jgi:low temperature requirement protein LtrA